MSFRIHRRGQREHGFSLIELAVALFILALLLGSILVPLQTQVESRKIDETQRILEQAREALIGFAAANGRFPCPALDASAGAEYFSAAPFPVGNAANGTCHPTTVGSNVYVGFLPAVTLGFTPIDANGFALDAWALSPQNRIRYAVSSTTVNTIVTPFTRTSGIRNAGMSNVAAANLLYVCNSGTGVVAGSNCGTAVTLISNAPVVVWSVGANAATSGGVSVDEIQNPNPIGAGGSRDRIFVSRPKSAGTSGEFDDIVTWIGPPTIFNRLIAAGQLP